MNNYQYIKDELDLQKRSISWLAKEIGVSKGYVSKILSNKISEPSNTKILAIHQALNIDNNGAIYEKSAYLINVDYLTIEKYIHVATSKLDEDTDIYILVNSKSINKDVNLRRFYDYLNFSQAKIILTTESELKKILSKKSYSHIITFNEEFAHLKNYEFTNINIDEKQPILIKKIANKSILLLSNDRVKLSILLNVLKLKTSYLIEDFSIFKDVNPSGNSLISNQLSVLEQINKSNQNSRLYITGNEYLSLVQDNDVSELKKLLISYDKYLDLFDLAINIDFIQVENNKKDLFMKNAKLLKASNLKHIAISNHDINDIADIIIQKVKEDYNEN